MEDERQLISANQLICKESTKSTRTLTNLEHVSSKFRFGARNAMNMPGHLRRRAILF